VALETEYHRLLYLRATDSVTHFFVSTLYEHVVFDVWLVICRFWHVWFHCFVTASAFNPSYL